VISYLAATWRGEGGGREGRGILRGEESAQGVVAGGGATSEPVKISRLARARVGRKKKLNPSIRAAPLRLLRRRRFLLLPVALPRRYDPYARSVLGGKR